jgi:hypothetical protein
MKSSVAEVGDIPKKRYRRALRFFALVCMLAAMGTTCFAQKENCDEKTVRLKGQTPLPQIAADDIYVNTTNSDKPLMGKDQLEEFRNQQLAKRKNQQPPHFYPERIVPSKAANMAYEYGRAHVEFDLATTGQHITYDTEYLRVWKVVDKVCKVAASFSRTHQLPGPK